MPVQWTQLRLIKSLFSAAHQTQSFLDESPECLCRSLPSVSACLRRGWEAASLAPGCWCPSGCSGLHWCQHPGLKTNLLLVRVVWTQAWEGFVLGELRSPTEGEGGCPSSPRDTSAVGCAGLQPLALGLDETSSTWQTNQPSLLPGGS